MSDTNPSYNEIIVRLEDFYKNRNILTYRGLEYSDEFSQDVKNAGIEFVVDPELPIDLVAVQQREEEDDKTGELKLVSYYTLHWFASEYDKGLETKLQFYRFYLSRLTMMWGVLIVIVVPANSTPRVLRRFQLLARQNGFGLWKIDISKPDPEQLCEALDFLSHMEKVFKNPPRKMERFESEVREKSADISLFFDRFVREAVESLAGNTLRQVGKRYVDRKLLDLVFDMNAISYGQELKRCIIEHLRKKGDDYQFVEDTFSVLWKKYIPEMDYSDFLRTAELPLYNIFAARGRPYRDHYLHQFQVFLMGLGIIDKLKGCDHPDIKEYPNIELQWLVTSSFHDMAYPLQLYDVWAKEFFNKSIDIPNIGVSDLKSSFVDRSLLSTLGFLLSELCKRHFDTCLEGNWLHEEKELMLFFYDRITKLKHHCLLSALFLLKQAQKCCPRLMGDVFIPASLAIALHHPWDVWKKLPKVEDDVWANLPSKRKLGRIEFKSHPLEFLLLFCDCVQEWGRPVLKYSNTGPITDDEKGKIFILDQCSVEESGCKVLLKSTRLSRTSPKFKRKEKEIEQLEKTLRSASGLVFEVNLEDKSGVLRPHPITGPNI